MHAIKDGINCIKKSYEGLEAQTLPPKDRYICFYTYEITWLPDIQWFNIVSAGMTNQNLSETKLFLDLHEQRFLKI